MKRNRKTSYTFTIQRQGLLVSASTLLVLSLLMCVHRHRVQQHLDLPQNTLHIPFSSTLYYEHFSVIKSPLQTSFEGLVSQRHISLYGYIIIYLLFPKVEKLYE